MTIIWDTVSPRAFRRPAPTSALLHIGLISVYLHGEIRPYRGEMAYRADE
jgi:hypothetical protein